MLDKHGHHFTIRARPIETERGHVEGLLVALLETTSQSIIAVDPQGVIVLANGYGDDVWLSARGTGRQNLEILIPVESRQRHIRRH